MDKNRFIHTKINNRGNISILVIFILIASSLIWILTTNYIKDLMQYNNIIYGYYKSYYLSKAWLELSLTEIWKNWIWFENTINTWDNIISWNFICQNCNFNSSISWNSSFFSKNTWTDSGCDNPIALNTWESFILPLFKQINNWSNFQKLTTFPIFKNMADKIANIELEDISTNKEITIWIFVMSWEDILQDWVFVKTWATNNPNIITNFLSEFETYATNILLWNYNLWYAYKDSSLWLKSFLIFGNSTDNQQSISFCINIKPTIWIADHITLPTSTFYIKSIWNNIEKTIWLEAFLKQPIPEFLIHTYLGS
jgi:hypothetical protein